jgi:hypothetical protein
MQAVAGALRRAAARAREIARQTGTPLVIVRDGVLMEVDPDDPSLDDEAMPARYDSRSLKVGVSPSVLTAHEHRQLL